MTMQTLLEDEEEVRYDWKLQNNYSLDQIFILDWQWLYNITNQ